VSDCAPTSPSSQPRSMMPPAAPIAGQCQVFKTRSHVLLSTVHCLWIERRRRGIADRICRRYVPADARLRSGSTGLLHRPVRRCRTGTRAPRQRRRFTTPVTSDIFIPSILAARVAVIPE
jgi:hypothetical protein